MAMQVGASKFSSGKAVSVPLPDCALGHDYASDYSCQVLLRSLPYLEIGSLRFLAILWVIQYVFNKFLSHLNQPKSAAFAYNQEL